MGSILLVAWQSSVFWSDYITVGEGGQVMLPVSLYLAPRLNRTRPPPSTACSNRTDEYNPGQAHALNIIPVFLPRLDYLPGVTLPDSRQRIRSCSNSIGNTLNPSVRRWKSNAEKRYAESEYGLRVSFSREPCLLTRRERSRTEHHNHQSGQWFVSQCRRGSGDCLDGCRR